MATGLPEARAWSINLASRIFCKTVMRNAGVMKLPSGSFSIISSEVAAGVLSALARPLPDTLVGLGEFVNSRASLVASGDASSL